MEDLNAASLEDVHEWFKKYYGAANAILIVAGDIDPTGTLDLVKAHFGDIPAGPPVTIRDDWVPERTPKARFRKCRTVLPMTGFRAAGQSLAGITMRQSTCSLPREYWAATRPHVCTSASSRKKSSQ